MQSDIDTVGAAIRYTPFVRDRTGGIRVLQPVELLQKANDEVGCYSEGKGF